MHVRTRVVTAVSAAVALSLQPSVAAQVPMPEMSMPSHDHAEMLHRELGGGWMVAGMAQAFPIVTFGDVGGPPDASLRLTEAYLTQPALMFNVEAPGNRVVLRTTLNFEGLTQADGELTPGGWGEGFIDKRHPHTLLHELMLSVNAWDTDAGTFSLSAGKGFAPYGTDDPMSRPVSKYPTNHHLSQILERWTVNAVWRLDGWSAEVGVFGGAEPEGPYDLSNIGSFGDSWSGRVAWRGGSDSRGAWEVSASAASVVEEHDGEPESTRLLNAAVRRDGALGRVRLYGLLEASTSDPEHGDGYYSVLAETQLTAGPHRPYARVEVATRPEYPRDGGPGSEGFFRYDHDAEAFAASGWTIATAGYGYDATNLPWSVRPFVEAQYNRVRSDRGPFDPGVAYGSGSFWTVSVGARIYLGGEPMRMGSYGILDAMTGMMRAMADMDAGMEMPMGAAR